MNRFLLFAWRAWEAGGGWNDFRGSFADLDSAVQKGKELQKVTYDCVHVIDSATGLPVYEDD